MMNTMTKEELLALGIEIPEATPKADKNGNLDPTKPIFGSPLGISQKAISTYYNKAFKCDTYVAKNNLYFKTTKAEGVKKVVTYASYNEALEVVKFMIQHGIGLGKMGICTIEIDTNPKSATHGRFFINAEWLPDSKK